MMMYRKTWLAIGPALLLAACGGEEQTVDEPAQAATMTYAYPADGQTNVSAQSTVVLRFSQAITDENAADKIQLRPTDGGDPVALNLVERVDGGRSLELASAAPLATGTEYSVTFSEPLQAGSQNVDTPNATGPEGIQFTTRGGFSGVASLANLSDTFEVAGTTPDGNQFGFMDFSTIRIQTTQPVHPESLVYGTTVSLTDSEGNLVPAELIGKGNQLTIDPCTTEKAVDCGSPSDELDPSQTYTLTLNGVTNLNGETLSYEQSFSPRETGPTEVLYQKAVPGGMTSMLNGNTVNAVTLNSVLQGQAGPSQQSGELYAELAYSPNFAGEPVPLRVPKGTVLESTSLEVKINGEVPLQVAGTNRDQKTGTIKVTMISDASGYLYPNPYSDSDEAPRHVRLWMDVSMNTEKAQPNAALSQNLMRVELTGIAKVRDGLLTIDAIGMVEPNLLGQEYTDSTIAFRLEADTGAQDDAPPRPLDNAGPELVSWMPGSKDAIPSTRQAMQRPGDPVVLNFNEPIDADSVAGGITLDADGTEVSNLDTKVDGTVVVVNPKGGLKHSVEKYTLTFDNGLTDLAGNGATSKTLTFSLPPIGKDATGVDKRPPIALTTYPGYPCETDFTKLNLNDGILGECYDASGNAYSGGRGATKDTLPVSKMPADRPITVVFSQSMNLESIQLGETFIVERVEADSNGKPKTPVGEGEPISGRLEKNNQRIRFYPDEPWNHGDGDHYYRYTMKSSQDPNPNTCESLTSVCGVNDLALKTDILEGLDDGGGDNGADDLVIYFEGVEPKETVFTPLRNLPIRDTNSNFLIDCNTSFNDSDNRQFENVQEGCLEPFNHEGSDEKGWAPSANATKLRVRNNLARGEGLAGKDVGAWVGCVGKEEPCPREKFIYQTYGLNTEVKGKGSYDPTPGQPDNGDTVQGVQVDLYPTMLTTTSVSVFAEVSLLGFIPLKEETVTNTQVLRMRYAKDDPSCTSKCERNSLIPGVITSGEDGQPVFMTRAELLIDAPDMVIPLGGNHDLYGRPFTLNLKGDITFFDDGRMQIEQFNSNLVGDEDELMVTADTAGVDNNGLVTLKLPLEIPEKGVYLNFISNPIKEIPAEG